MNRKVDALMQAIAEHEGWLVPGENNSPNGSTAYRNHNPGNLRKSPFAAGERDGFAFFRNDFVGWNALQWDLMQKARGNTSTGLTGSSTIRQLITAWAPPSDNNDTEAYIAAVMKKTGLPETTTLAQIFNL